MTYAEQWEAECKLVYARRAYGLKGLEEGLVSLAEAIECLYPLPPAPKAPTIDEVVAALPYNSVDEVRIVRIDGQWVSTEVLLAALKAAGAT